MLGWALIESGSGQSCCPPFQTVPRGLYSTRFLSLGLNCAGITALTADLVSDVFFHRHMRFLVHEPFAIHFHQLVDLALLEARWISLDSAAAYSSCKPTIKASRGESVMMTMIGWWLLEVFLACIHFCETEGLRGSFSFSVRASEVSYRSRRRRIRFVSTSLCMQFVCRMPRESYRYYVTEEVERHKQQRGCPESERHNLLCYSSVYDYTLYLANCTVCTGKHYFVEKSRVIKQSGCPKSESHTM